MKKTMLLVCIGLACGSFAATYNNPILPMDFSDPDVCMGHPGLYYMTASSFGGIPGLPILQSADLVHWKYIGHALTQHPWQDHGSWHDESPLHGKAVWAPSIRACQRTLKTELPDGGVSVRGWTEFVIYWGDPDRGIYRVTAKNPEGPWSEPVLVKKGRGMIDPCPLYDDDGRIYLVHGWAASRAKMNSVLTVSELNADETATIGEEVMVYDGIPDGNFTAEGPKFYKRNGEYWLFFPAGGVERGWQVAARAKSPFGPYSARTVMAQGKSKINGPHQGAWIHCGTQNSEGEALGPGEDWFVHFSDRGAYGRVVCLEPMKWREDGWPVIGTDPDGDGCGEPVEEHQMPNVVVCRKCLHWPCTNETHVVEAVFPQTSDEFDAPRLGLQWQWLGRSEEQVGFPTTQGYYRLYTTPMVVKHKSSVPSGSSFWETPNLLVQKFPAFAFTATVKARIGAKEDGEECGLIVQGLDHARLGLKSKGDSFDVVYTVCRDAETNAKAKTQVLATVPATLVDAGIRSAKVKDVWLKVSVAPGETPKDTWAPVPVCTFAYSFDGEKWTDVKDKFNARQGKWIGATFGIFAVADPDCKDRGWIDIDYVRVSDVDR